jgi:small-conductance mechanosensitive channel
MATSADVINEPLFHIADKAVTPATLFAAVGVVVMTLGLAAVVRRGMKAAVRRRGGDPGGGLALVGRILSATLVVLGVSVALQTAGIDLGAVFAAGAVFTVGFGVAMQGVMVNFVSGFILLFERTVKPNDVLELEKQVVRVMEIGIRVTLVRTLNDEELLVPNTLLVQATVKNFTHADSLYRVRVEVGVAYESDLDLVRSVLERTAAEIPWRETGEAHTPRVLCSDFSDSSIVYDVSVWSIEPWLQLRQMSDMRERIWRAFKANGIVIAFPQVDVHFDQPVNEALKRVG